MIGKLIGAKWKLWAIGGLAVVLAGAVWQWREEIEARVRYAVQGEQMAQELREAEQRAEDYREERKRLERLANEREQQLDALRERQRETRRELEDIRAQSEIWDRRIPDDAARWLRGETRSGDSDGD